MTGKDSYEFLLSQGLEGPTWEALPPLHQQAFHNMTLRLVRAIVGAIRQAQTEQWNEVEQQLGL